MFLTAPQLADTPVPLSLLLSKGIGNAGPVVTSTVAGLLALGSITSYLAGAGSARRGAGSRRRTALLAGQGKPAR